jgi:general stress protein 26
VKNEEEILGFLRNRIKDIDIAMLATLSLNGNLRSRPMSTIEMDAEGRLWFFTSCISRKVAEITNNNSVNLTYSDPHTSAFVSVTGRAELVDDPVRRSELWKPVFKAWFPEGPDDVQLKLLKVYITEAEYWDVSSSRMVQLFEMARALVSGEKYQVSDHEKFKINPYDNREEITS